MDNSIKFKRGEAYYRTEGKGKIVIVLVHGFMEEGFMWNGVVNSLKSSYRIIVPDLPGFGRSVLKSKTVSMEFYADFLNEVLKKEKVNQCILLGHSMGGYVALHFAEKHPRMLRGLGLINSHCYADSKGKKAGRQKTIDFVLKHGTRPFVKELYTKMFFETYAREHPKIVQEFVKRALRYKPEAVIAATRAMIKRKDKSEVLKKLKVPLLIVLGKQDEIVSQDDGINQASLADVTDFHLVNDSRHLTVIEKKQKALKAIKSFLEICDNHFTGNSPKGTLLKS